MRTNILLLFFAFSQLSLLAQSDFLKIGEQTEIPASIVTDTLLYKTLELDLKEISKSDFENYQKTYKPKCNIDTSGFISGYGLSVQTFCKDICETYLVENETSNKILLPSDYDAGILGMTFSPSCRQFIVYSSYDGTDYDEYYENRAEIFGFEIAKDKGLKSVKPAFVFNTKDWSIEDLIWINEHTLALKLYEEDRWGDGSEVHYKYYETKLIIKDRISDLLKIK